MTRGGKLDINIDSVRLVNGDRAPLRASTPDGADIEMDGSFVGSTPSTVGAAVGQHQLAIKKNGFKPWEKTLTVSTGHIKIDATLEAESK